MGLQRFYIGLACSLFCICYPGQELLRGQFSSPLASKCSGLAPSLLWSLRLSLLVPALLMAFVLKALAFPFTYHSVQVPAYLLALEVPCFPENPVKHLKNMLFIIYPRTNSNRRVLQIILSFITPQAELLPLPF